MIYRVANWGEKFETYETRKIANLSWVATPNKHDGLGFRKIASLKNRCELFAAWNLILQVASKGKKAERGALIRDGKPLTADDLAIMTGFPAKIFEDAFAFFSSGEVGWLTVDNQHVGEPPVKAGNHPVKAGCAAAEQNRTEGTEQKEQKEGNGTVSPVAPAPLILVPDVQPPKSPSAELKAAATLILMHLNSTAVRNFQPRNDTLKPIIRRLSEGCSPEDLKLMINREVKLQGPNSKWLQTSTLFGKNFWASFDDRNQPIFSNANTTHQQSSGNSRPTPAQQRNAQITGADRIRAEIERDEASHGPHGETPEFLADTIGEVSK